MAYDSTITFTLDTICPWTYIAKKRLDAALSQIRSTSPNVTFTVNFQPYQLYPDAPATPTDKYAWYRATRYNDSEEQMQKYVAAMSALGEGAGIPFKFHGKISNTLHAHRVLQVVQERRGAGAADAFVNALYKQYFEEEQAPATRETLLAAAAAAGIPAQEAQTLVEDEGEGMPEVRAALRETVSNGVDAVPVVTIEGRRRDFTLTGAKPVDEYVKALASVIKESQ